MAQDDANCRTVEVDYNGKKHRAHWKLQRWTLCVTLVGGIIGIMAVLGGIGVWAGNQVWHSKDEAREHELTMTDKVESLQDSVNSIRLEIDRLQSQVIESNRQLSDFIEESKRLRLEDLIRETEQEIANYERQIQEDGKDSRARDRHQLQKLKSERNQYQRQLNRLYEYQIGNEDRR